MEVNERMKNYRVRQRALSRQVAEHLVNGGEIFERWHYV